MNNLNNLLIVVIITIFFYIGYYSISTKEPQETIQKIEEVSDGVKNIESQRETKENTKENVAEIIPETPQRRPLTFKKFLVVVKISCDEPRDDKYVQKEIKRLISLTKSISDAKDIEITSLQGISRKEEVFEINLD